MKHPRDTSAPDEDDEKYSDNSIYIIIYMYSGNDFWFCMTESVLLYICKYKLLGLKQFLSAIIIKFKINHVNVYNILNTYLVEEQQF